MAEREEYLGDGLYASFDGFSFTLRAPREGGDHYVVLEPAVLGAFERFVLITKQQRAAAVEHYRQAQEAAVANAYAAAEAIPKPHPERCDCIECIPI